MKNLTRNRRKRFYSLASIGALLFALVCCHMGCRVSVAHNKKVTTIKPSTVIDSLPGVPTHNPDGFEIPAYVRGQIAQYNAMLLSHADVTLCDEATYLACVKKGIPVLSVEVDANQTRITTLIKIGWNWNWGFTDKGTSLIDPATGDRYMIRGVEGKTELGRLFYYPYTLKGQAVLKTMIFPPLKEGVTTVDISYPANFIDVPAKDNGTEGYTPGVVIADYPPVEKPNGQVIR